MHNVRLKASARAEIEALPSGLEKRRISELLYSLEDNPFPLNVIKLEPVDAYAIICGLFYITYIVIGDDVVVCSVKQCPE